MISLTATQIATIVDGKVYGDSGVKVTQAPTFDSREVISGSLFLALKGASHDGHDFAESALAAGAVLALTNREINGDCVVVDDVLIALGKLAAYVRTELKDLIVIGITGSQGKTSTKDLLVALLSTSGTTVAPIGSHNNELGLPITLLQCDWKTKYCILEMGARHKGDIAVLCKIAKPNIGVVLKVGSAHIGEFGSVDAIAQTKGELISSLGKDGIAILGSYDPFTIAMSVLHSGKVITFGEKSTDEIRATDLEMREGCPHFDLVTPSGRDAVGMRLIGSHQVSNALAAAAVGTALGLPIELIASSLSTAQLRSKWRMELHELENLLLINDAYNANPDSMAAAIRTLALFAQDCGGQSWAFLGKMSELGESSAKEHSAIGTLAQEIGIDHLVAISSPAYGAGLKSGGLMKLHNMANIEQATSLVEHFAPGDVVLVKASRSEHLEDLVVKIENSLKEIEAGGKSAK